MASRPTFNPTKKSYFLLLLLAALFPLLAGAQAVTILRLNPTNWWVGMKNNSVQLLVYGLGSGTLAYTLPTPACSW